MPCITGILRQQNEQLQNYCKTISVDFNVINVKRVTPASVVIATDGEKIEERCYLEPPQLFDLKPNTYLLTVKPGCLCLRGKELEIPGNQSSTTRSRV